MDISQTIKQLRISHGLSQEKLANSIHVTQQTISNWERGSGSPDSYSLLAICESFHIPIDELLADEKDKA